MNNKNGNSSKSLDDNSRAKARIKWQCRRGMLELDVLLERFLDTGYNELSVDEQALFSTLLKCSDQVLFEYLMGQMRPGNKVIENVIARIRHTAST